MEKRKYDNEVEGVYRDVIKKELAEEAEVVKATLPHPFGSFEKATYELKRNRNRHSEQYFYRFTTTCHNTEECVEVLKEKFGEQITQQEYCTIVKIQNGKKEELFHGKI